MSTPRNEAIHAPIRNAEYTVTDDIHALMGTVSTPVADHDLALMIADGMAQRGRLWEPAAGCDTRAARLVALRSLRVIEANVATRTKELVDQLRTDGATWQEIGEALFVTRSAAQQKFGTD